MASTMSFSSVVSWSRAICLSAFAPSLVIQAVIDLRPSRLDGVAGVCFASVACATGRGAGAGASSGSRNASVSDSRLRSDDMRCILPCLSQGPGVDGLAFLCGLDVGPFERCPSLERRVLAGDAFVDDMRPDAHPLGAQ